MCDLPGFHMKTFFRRLTAAVLAATMLFSSSIPTTVFAAEPSTEAASTDVQLQNGTAIIPSGSEEATVKQILFDALVVNKEGVDPQSLEWEYYCTGKKWTSHQRCLGIDQRVHQRKENRICTNHIHPSGIGRQQ